MIAHHQHWLLAFTALLSRNGSRQARTQGANASETRTAGGDRWNVPEHAAGGGGVNRPQPRLAGRWRGEGSSYTWVACLSNRTRAPPQRSDRLDELRPLA